MSVKTKTQVATEKIVRKPRKTSSRKRPNKKYIMRMVEFTGTMTPNQKTQLATLIVKNALQRINNIAMSDDVNEIFNNSDNTELQKLCKAFVKSVNAVLEKQ